jgi:hypothetical protein
MKNNTKDLGSDKPGLDDLITLNEAAKLSGFTIRHMRHLAVTGEIWAKKLGRNWFTTPQAVQDYLSLNKKPGPKPQKRE